MRILFWNTYENAEINFYIAKIVQYYKIDVLILGEYAANKQKLKILLEQHQCSLFPCNTAECERIHIFTNYDNVVAGLQDKYYSIQIIRDKFILCATHLISDIHGGRYNERKAIIRAMMHDIAETENDIQSKLVIIVGDMNEMPYDGGCLDADGFHGLPTLSPTESPTRTICGTEYQKFYNPMWNLFGDFSFPPGTYYLNKSTLRSPRWYMLDQIILSQDVVPIFRKETLQIVTSCDDIRLTNRNGHPDENISDHFPIMCEIKD